MDRLHNSELHEDRSSAHSKIEEERSEENRFRFTIWFKIYFSGLITKKSTQYQPEETRVLQTEILHHRRPSVIFLHSSINLIIKLMDMQGCIDRHDYTKISTEDEARPILDEEMKKLLAGETVYFLPARMGQESFFLWEQWGAKAGIVTNEQYMPSVLSMFEKGRLGCDIDHLSSTDNIALLVNADLEELPQILKQNSDQDPNDAAISEPFIYDGSHPDIVISTNFFTKERFEGSKEYKHTTGISWQKHLARMLSLGQPNKTFFLITPNTENELVCKPEEMIAFIESIPGTIITFVDEKRYEKEEKYRHSIFQFIVQLTQEVPQELL
ncbi:MAG: hypothetical protein WCW14_03875 [Candidatus Paceibacterota bacterium]